MKEVCSRSETTPASPCNWDLSFYLAKDLQTFLLLVTGGQQSKLLQQQRGGRGGDVQIVFKSLEDGAWWDAVLVCPVTDDTCQEGIQHNHGSAELHGSAEPGGINPCFRSPLLSSETVSDEEPERSVRDIFVLQVRCCAVSTNMGSDSAAPSALVTLNACYFPSPLTLCMAVGHWARSQNIPEYLCFFYKNISTFNWSGEQGNLFSVVPAQPSNPFFAP